MAVKEFLDGVVGKVQPVLDQLPDMYGMQRASSGVIRGIHRMPNALSALAGPGDGPSKEAPSYTRFYVGGALTYGAVGGLAGYFLTGTPEKKLRNAAIGAGVGAAASLALMKYISMRGV